MSEPTNFADAEARSDWLQSDHEPSRPDPGECADDTPRRDVTSRVCNASWFISHDRRAWAACPECNPRFSTHDTQKDQK